LKTLFIHFVSAKHFQGRESEGKGVSQRVGQQFLTVGAEKSPNNNADRTYRTAGWVEITRMEKTLCPDRKWSFHWQTDSRVGVDNEMKKEMMP
jgi:hypothetical protein